MAELVQTIEMEGLKELEKALDELTDVKFRRKALVDAGKHAMEPVLTAAINNAPRLTAANAAKNPNAVSGQLKNDIKMSTSYNKNVKASRNGNVSDSKKTEMKVVVKTGAETEDYALVAEIGRDEFQVMRSTVFGKKTDKPYLVKIAAIKPQPYMRPALDSNVNRVLNRFYYELGESIHRQAKRQERLAKKKGKK